MIDFNHDVHGDVLDHRDKEDGISPMMAAVGAGRLEVVRHLVKVGNSYRLDI